MHGETLKFLERFFLKFPLSDCPD